MLIFFGAIHVGSRGRMMGEGDIYLASLLGLILGLELSVVMWFTAFLSGTIYSLALIALKKVTVKDILPFGPFIILGSGIALLFGDYLLYFLNF